MERGPSSKPSWLARGLGNWGYDQWRCLRSRLGDRRIGRLLDRPTSTVVTPSMAALLGGVPAPSGITDHLGALFFYTVLINARLVVELGTRGGDSTRALLAAVSVTGGRMLSIDINDCSHVQLPPHLQSRWQFLQADDVAFGKDEFPRWCQAAGLPPVADLVFIDTSHLYEHTVQEIETWKQYVPPGGAMMFHDTNMGCGVFQRLDGSFGEGWDNDRGVIRAIEDLAGSHYDENCSFVDVVGRDWFVSHQPYSNGLTVLLRARGASDEKAAVPPVRSSVHDSAGQLNGAMPVT